MMDGQDERSGGETPPPHAPPLYPGVPAPEAKPPVWSTAVGVLMLVFASLGLLGSAGSCAGGMAMGVFGPLAEAAGGTPARIGGAVTALLVVAGLLGLAVEGIGLAGGIGLLTRRGWAPRACIIWGVLRIGTSVLEAVASHFYMKGMLRPTAAEAAMFEASALAYSACWMLVWGWGPAVFILIWLNLPRVKEHALTWR